VSPRTLVSVPALGLALLMAAGLCACSPDAPPATPRQAPAAATAAPAFGGTDRAWIEINVAMNEELAPLLALVPAQSRDQAIKDLAAQLDTVRLRELEDLRGLHDAAGLPAENPHKGMPMPGMVTPDIVRQAAAAKGPAFDLIFRKEVKAHLDQGVKLARSEATAGVEPRTKALAERMITDRETFLPKFTPAVK
jgi:uncharacterized protein (DUF305 family)